MTTAAPAPLTPAEVEELDRYIAGRKPTVSYDRAARLWERQILWGVVDPPKVDGDLTQEEYLRGLPKL